MSIKPMKRTLNSAVQLTAVPFDNYLFRLGGVGGAIQRRLSPIRSADGPLMGNGSVRNSRNRQGRRWILVGTNAE